MKRGGVNEILLGEYSCTCNQPCLLMKKNRQVCDKNSEQKAVFFGLWESLPPSSSIDRDEKRCLDPQLLEFYPLFYYS